jgi:hypothetical protein
MRTLGRTAVGAAVLSLLAVTSPLTAGAVTSTTTTVPVVPPIESLVLTTPLPGFTVNSPGPTNGPLTAPAVAQFSNDPTVATQQFDVAASQPGFAAYQRVWTDVHGPGQGANVIADLLFRIPSPAAAVEFTIGLRQQLATTAGATSFAVPSIAGATGTTSVTNGPGGVPVTEHNVVFRTGGYVAEVQLASASASINPTPFTPAQAVAVAYEQYQLVVGVPASVTPVHVASPHTAASASDGSSNGPVIAVVIVVVLVVLIVLLLLARRRRNGNARADGGEGLDALLAPAGFVLLTSPAGTGEAPVGVPDLEGSGDTEDGPDGTPVGPGVDDPVDDPVDSAAGWLPDPSGDTDQVRYWDGSAWTEHVAVRSTDS